MKIKNLILDIIKIIENKIKGADYMSKKNNTQKNTSMKQQSENSRNSNTGYMDRGNGSKNAAENGTRNKN